MPILVNGVPDPRIVLLKQGLVVDDIVLPGTYESGEDAPTYLTFEPDILRHELDPQTGSEVYAELFGFRMRLQLHWQFIDGSELQLFRKLFDRRLYDELRVYPWSREKPFWWVHAVLEGDPLVIDYHYLAKHKDFSLHLHSKKLLDYVPLENPDWLTWGSISLRFKDLGTLAFSSYYRTLTIQQGGEGSAEAKSYGYLEEIGTGQWRTDAGGVVTLIAIPDTGWHFDRWVIGIGNNEIFENPMSLLVLSNVTVTVSFLED